MLGVIIVNYNGGALLGDCLQALYSDLGDTEAQVWLVDNASTDTSLQCASAQFPQLHIIANRQNIGFAAANNQALRELLPQGPDHILLLNPDAVIRPGAIPEMLRFMGAHPEVGIAGPRIVRPNGELDWPCRRSFKTPAIYLYKTVGLDRLFPRSQVFGRYHMRYLPEEQGTEVDAIIGAFMLLRRAVVEQIGLLDELFYIYCEDEDWCWRAKQAGWRIYYHPAAVVTHVKGASTRQRKLRMIYELHKGYWLFHRKNMAPQYRSLTNTLVYAGIAATLGIKLGYHAARNLAVWARIQRLNPARAQAGLPKS